MSEQVSSDPVTVKVESVGAFRQILYTALEDASSDLTKALDGLSSPQNPARNRVVQIADKVNRLGEVVNLLDQVGLSDRDNAQDAEVVPLRVLETEGDGAA